jgi:hypothetical protein
MRSGVIGRCGTGMTQVGANAASGVYFYALRVGGMHEVKKMLYVK